jgi:hypothetical protein
VRDINIGSYTTLNNDYVINKTKSSHRFVDRNYNSFFPLLDYNTKFYKCNNYGNIAHDYRRNIIKSSKQNREGDVLTKNKEEYTNVWKRKQEELKEEGCGLEM